MKTESKIKIYAIDGEKTAIPSPTVTIANHWSRKALVNITVDVKGTLTLDVDELERAIRNAQNAHW